VILDPAGSGSDPDPPIPPDIWLDLSGAPLLLLFGNVDISADAQPLWPPPPSVRSTPTTLNDHQVTSQVQQTADGMSEPLDDDDEDEEEEEDEERMHVECQNPTDRCFY